MITPDEFMDLRGQHGVLNPLLVAKAGFIQDFDPDRVQGNSIDLRIERVFRVDGGVTIWANGERELPPYIPVGTFLDPKGREMFKFHPDHLYQVEFKEKVDLPHFICALTILRSSMFKSGASSETGLFDSGYRGGTGTVVSVKSPSYIELGASVAQMVFFSSRSAKDYNGYYQDRDDWRVLKGEG